MGGELAAGDFDGDGYQDLAVASVMAGVEGVAAAGAVYVLRGSSAGLGLPNQVLWQGSPDSPDSAKEDDMFGTTLAAGDFNGDGVDDLAVGIPFNDSAGSSDSGAVQVIYGSPERGLGYGPQLFLTQETTGFPGDSGPDHWMGWGLAAADFDHDGWNDLAIGVPSEDSLRGAVAVVLGSGSGLVVAGNQLWQPDSPGMLSPLVSGAFGSALAAGDFDADSFSDLAIGAYFAEVPTSSGPVIEDAGGVRVLRGSPVGLTARRNRVFTQESDGFPDAAEPSDFLGYSLASGDFNGDGFADLAMGAQGDGVRPNYWGSVTLIYRPTPDL